MKNYSVKSSGQITISANELTSGSYTYSLLKTTNANYSDALSSYGASNILNPIDSGTYQVRIKDNCGNFITKTVFIQPSVPSIYLYSGWSWLANNQPIFLQIKVLSVIKDFQRGLLFYCL